MRKTIVAILIITALSISALAQAADVDFDEYIKAGKFGVDVTEKKEEGKVTQKYSLPEAEKINVKYKDAMINDIISALAMCMNKNVLFLEEPVITSYEVLNVPPNEALSLLLTREGLSYIEQSNILIVGTPTKLKSGFFDRLSVYELRLQHITAQEMDEYLSTLGVDINRITISSNKESLWARGLPQELAQVKNIKEKLDIPANISQQMQMEKIVLRHISPDYLVQLASGLDLGADVLSPEKGRSVIWARGTPQDIDELKQFIGFVDDPANKEQQLPLQRIGLRYITTDTLLDIVQQAELEVDIFVTEHNKEAVWAQGTQEEISKLTELVRYIDNRDNQYRAKEYRVFAFELENTVPKDAMERIKEWDFQDLKIIGFNFPEFGNDILVICQPEIRSDVVKALNAIDDKRRKVRIPVMKAQGTDPESVLKEWAGLLAELLRNRNLRRSSFVIPDYDLLGGTGALTPGGRIIQQVMYVEATPDEAQLVTSMLQHLGAPDVLVDDKKESTPRITLAQFYKTTIGMTYDEVRETLGGPGRLMTESTEDEESLVVYAYDGQEPGSYALLTFRDGRLSSKDQSGLK